MTLEEIVEALRRAGVYAGVFAQDEQAESAVEFVLDWIGMNEAELTEYMAYTNDEEII